MAINASLPAQVTAGVTAVRSLRAGLTAATLGALVVVGTAMLLVETSLVASSGYDNAHLLGEKRALEHRSQELQGEVASLISLDHVESQARSRLGMVDATAGNTIYIQVDPRLKDGRDEPRR